MHLVATERIIRPMLLNDPKNLRGRYCIAIDSAWDSIGEHDPRGLGVWRT
jgi:hypothetical protein